MAYSAAPPLISHQAARRLEDQVARAAKDGAALRLGGRHMNEFARQGPLR